MNGFINLYKEKGWTSFDCVAKLRRILGQKKIGHMGTLDPDACGVLPIALGKATRLISLFDDNRKTYKAGMLLGCVTDTLDTSGQILEEKPVCVTEECVAECLRSFIGTSKQIPPMYSALKKDGKRLYELARSGITVEREARPITIYDLKILSLDIPHVQFKVTCSKGTYIRSLCDDAGRKLGCGACMEQLERTAVGAFSVENSLTVSEIEEHFQNGNIQKFVLDLLSAFPELPRIKAKTEADVLAHNGNAVPSEMLQTKTNQKEFKRFWLLDSNEAVIGIYERDHGKAYPVKMVYEV